MSLSGGSTHTMKLAAHSLHPVYLPYRRAVCWASTEESGADFLLLRLTSDTGHVGVAEATAKPTWAGATPRVLAAALEDIFLPRLASVDLGDEQAVESAIGRIPDNGIAKALIHSACWDLRSAAVGVPLWRLWNGKPDVPMSWTVSRQPPTDMAREAAEMVERHGFGTLKVKGGQTHQTDFQALAEIRAAVGDDIIIYVDANGAYSEKESLDYVAALAERGVVMVEDPYRLQPNDDFQSFQSRCPIPVLVDGACGSPADASAFFAHGAQAIGVKPGRLGLYQGRRCSEIAAANGGATIVGLFGESDFGALLSSTLAASLPDGPGRMAAEPSFFLMMREGLLKEPSSIVDGVLHLPDVPGLDDLVDWERVRRLNPS